MKTSITRKRSERFGWAQRLNGVNAEGYKRPVDKNRNDDDDNHNDDDLTFVSTSKLTPDLLFKNRKSLGHS